MAVRRGYECLVYSVFLVALETRISVVVGDGESVLGRRRLRRRVCVYVAHRRQ